MDKELKVGVDEFSLVLFYPVDDICADWQNTAYSMIQEFIYKADIELLLGKVVEMRDKKPQAYHYSVTRNFCAYGNISSFLCSLLGSISKAVF